MTRLTLVWICLGLIAATPPAESPPEVITRSRLFLRLDPSITPDPDGQVEPSAIGMFRLVARGETEAEAAGWIAHAPGSARRFEDPVTGDVSTLRIHRGFGPMWVEAGRYWTSLGGQRLSQTNGVSVGVRPDERLSLAARAGLDAARPGEAFGESWEFGGEARLRLIDAVSVGVGVINLRPDEAAARTRLTVSTEVNPAVAFDARGAVTVDAESRAVVDARGALAAHPSRAWWLRGYGRFARIDQLLPFDDLLAVFAPNPRGEMGGLAEWQPVRALRLRADGAWVGVRQDHVGGRLRLGADVFPRPGARLSIEGTARSEPEARSGLLRLAGRWPLRGTWFATAEALGDATARPTADLELGGVTRVGSGFEPWPGWFAYGALEAARTPRWPERLAAMLLVEHALGAPVRWGGAP